MTQHTTYTVTHDAKNHFAHLRNHWFLPAMAREGSIDGHPSEALISYYNTMTQKGFGLVILEHAYVNKNGKASPKQMGIDAAVDAAMDANGEPDNGAGEHNSDRHTFEAIAQAIHQHNVPAIMQLSHAGQQTRATLPQLTGPSAGVVMRAGKPTAVRELSCSEISSLVDDFVAAAKRAQSFGFDGVEIHSAHGYLLSQFYSPLVNKRNDSYGGSLENRLRFHCEILQAIRRELPDFPLFVRLGARDYEDGGNTLSDAVQAACILAPYIDYLDISGGIHDVSRHDTNPAYPLGYFSETCAAIKREFAQRMGSANGTGADNVDSTHSAHSTHATGDAHFDVPVLMAGGLTSAKDGDALLQQGICDFAGFGRAALRNNFML